MGNLILNSLEIQRFRGFRHLQVERLGRVNLIVGKNNIGKTSLLEALKLYSHGAYPLLIWEILRGRDESAYDPYRRGRAYRGDDGKLLSELKYLFYGRKDIDIGTPPDPILMGPMHSPEQTLSFSIGWYITETAEDGSSKIRLIRPEEYKTVDNPALRFRIGMGEQHRSYLPTAAISGNVSGFNSVFIAANGLETELVEQFWDSIVLREAEEDVLTALRILAPGVERLSLAGVPDARQLMVREAYTREQERVPIVRVKGIDEPVPLRSLGNGMLRALGIALALVNARDGMLLIDEIENGLHYSIQSDLWRLIFKLAHRLNVQVFATTHSWDCIEGFQKAAQEDWQEEGLLIRLQSRDREISAVLFDKEELAIATQEQIEVR